MRGRLARRGLVVLAVVGVALVGAVPAGAKVKSVAGDGVVKVGEVPCGAAPCTLRAPSRVRVTIGGQAFRAKVAVPRRVAVHAVATVRVKLGAEALRKLAGATAQVKVRVVVRADGTKKVSVAQARIGRPASSESGPGGSTPTAPSAAHLDPDRRRTAAPGAARDRGHRQQRDPLLDAA